MLSSFPLALPRILLSFASVSRTVSCTEVTHHFVVSFSISPTCSYSASLSPHLSSSSILAIISPSSSSLYHLLPSSFSYSSVILFAYPHHKIIFLLQSLPPPPFLLLILLSYPLSPSSPSSELPHPVSSISSLHLSLSPQLSSSPIFSIISASSSCLFYYFPPSFSSSSGILFAHPRHHMSFLYSTAFMSFRHLHNSAIRQL